MSETTNPYISEGTIYSWIRNYPHEIIGYSFLNRPIYQITWGNGPIKVMIWSQMHGNESTGLRAMMQLLDKWKNNSNNIGYLQKFTIVFIPQLNPDGASNWQRVNAQGIDLNRDLLSTYSPEIALFKSSLKAIRPHFALNLHDQRTVFQRGDSGQPTSIALAIPRVKLELKNEELENNRRFVRYLVLQLLNESGVAMSNYAVFDESYYARSIGEYVQERGVKTLLVESGVGGLDLERNESTHNTAAFIEAYLERAANSELKDSDSLESNYSDADSWGLPPNKAGLVDIVLRRAVINSGTSVWRADISLQMESILMNEKIVFRPIWLEIGDLQHQAARVKLENVQLHWDVEKYPFQLNEPFPFWEQIKNMTPWANISV